MQRRAQSCPRPVCLLPGPLAQCINECEVDYDADGDVDSDDVGMLLWMMQWMLLVMRLMVTSESLESLESTQQQELHHPQQHPTIIDIHMISIMSINITMCMIVNRWHTKPEDQEI